MNRESLEPGGALSGRLFQDFLRRLSEAREPEIGEHIGVWKIRAELGRGGSGVVFLAERADGAFHQQVALKWLRGDRPVPGGRDALLRERELLASLDHPHIARLIDGGETEDGMRWFAMDYAAGKTIGRHAARLDRSERLRLIATVCRAVHHAHRRGLIHGDIKPSNVLVDERRQPRLVDFSISRLRGSGPGSSYGLTPDYASPEQRRGEPLTTASDIWQLGRLLSDMLSDARAPRDLRAVVDRAMAGAPEERYHSAEALAQDIDAWLEHRPVDVHTGGAGYRLVRAVQRNVLLSAVTGVALAIILGGGAWLVVQLAEERDAARQQADRAEAALADTAAALARAETLRDFLINLFEATRPDRPQDELPSTAQILQRGAEQALDAESAPPRERIAMLSTIGGVYMAQSQYDEAGPLIDRALTLAREQDAVAPADHARALEHKADWLIRSGGELERAEALLVEAEQRLSGSDAHWELLARVRITRTWVRRHRGDYAEALDLLEPVHASMPAGASESVQAGLFDALAGLHAATGNLDQAARFRERALTAFRNTQGPEGQGYVVALANSVSLELRRGRFQSAERRARKALSLYDRIYDDPVDYRAALRRGLAQLLFLTGRIESAFEQLRRSSEEYAAIRVLAPDEWPLHYSVRGRFHVRLGQYDRAISDLDRAFRLINAQGDAFDARLIETVAMLRIWAKCRRGGEDAPLPKAAQDLALAHYGHPRIEHQLRETRAACLASDDRPEQALAKLAPLIEEPIEPGGLVDAADRRLLAADVLARLGRRDRALALLDEARQAFAEHGLSDHPVADRLGRGQQRLR